MARPTKAVAATVEHFTSEELKNRLDNETKLKGESDKLKPPSYLTVPQKKIFRYIVTNSQDCPGCCITVGGSIFPRKRR